MIDTKVCYRCGKEKNVNCFSINKSQKDGFNYICKDCNREQRKQPEKQAYNREYRQRNKRSKNGWYTKTYGRMKRDNKNKFNLDLPFSKDEFISWIKSTYGEKFEKLFSNYVNSGCEKYLNPSIDRIDDYKSYTFDNMQLLTWRENDTKGTNGIKNKVSCAEVGKKYCSKTVIQYDESMNEIMRFSSTHEVERIFGFDSSLIAKACREHFKSKGFYWRYKTED